MPGVPSAGPSLTPGTLWGSATLCGKGVVQGSSLQVCHDGSVGAGWCLQVPTGAPAQNSIWPQQAGCALSRLLWLLWAPLGSAHLGEVVSTREARPPHGGR